MKKRTLLVLLVAVFFMLLGSALFLVPFFTQSTTPQPTVYAVNADFQHIEIDLEKTNLTICWDDKTYVEIDGYRESEYFITTENGKLLVTDRSEKSPLLFKLSGIGKTIKESRQVSEQKSMILHLARRHRETPVNLIVKNSTVTLSASLSYLTLHAENSSVTANDMTFDRFNGKLINCQSSFSFPYSAGEFSRSIETHNTAFSINGDERANTEQFVTDFQKPSLVIEASGGSCRLEYPQDLP